VIAMKKILFAAAVLVAVVIGIAAASGGGGNDSKVVGTASGTSTSGASPTQPRYAHPGDVVEFKVNDSTARATLNATRWEAKAADPMLSAPAHGWLIGDFTFDVTAGSVPINTLYFSVTLPDGTKVQPAAHADFNGSEVAAGRNARGEVYFDVAQGQTVLIDYTDPLGSTLVTWQVKV
jgi:hypothetical protein